MADDALYVREDNVIEWDGMELSSDGSEVNDATVTMTLYRNIANDGAITAAGTSLTSASQPFVAGDASRSVIVRKAGDEGEDLLTTISAYVSAGAVTLAAAAVTTVSGVSVLMSLSNAVGLSLAYVAASSGKYQGTIPATVNLADGAEYWLAITATSGSNDGFRLIPIKARYHRAVAT